MEACLQYRQHYTSWVANEVKLTLRPLPFPSPPHTHLLITRPSSPYHCPLFILLQALTKSGYLLGNHYIRVMPSKTAIVPVKQEYLPRSLEDQVKVARTVYVANIHKSVERDAVKLVFRHTCGEKDVNGCMTQSCTTRTVAV
jgi:hypothetical protein